VLAGLHASANLRRRFEMTGSAGDIEEAIRWSEMALELDGGSDDASADVLANAAINLCFRFERDHEPTDLDTALGFARAAVGERSTGQSEHASTLANILVTRYEHAGTSADLDEAIELLKAAIATPHGPQPSPLLLSNLGAFLTSRYEARDSVEDLDAAIVALNQAVDLTDEFHSECGTYLANAATA
jgi:tetratricopeptide (TPR) repeat protein